MSGLEKTVSINGVPHRFVNWLENGRRWFALGAVLAALVGVGLDVFADVGVLNIALDAPATSPLTAMGVLCIAISIVYSDRREGRVSVNVITALLAIAVCVIPHAMVLFRLPEIETNIFQGKVGLDTALIVVLLATSVLMRFRSVMIGLGTGLIATAFVLNALIGLTYGIPYFDGEMAPMTLLALIATILAVASLYLHRPLVRVMFLSGANGTRTRIMMGVGFSAPWISGLLLYHWYGVPVRDFPVEATLISVIIGVMLVVTLVSGYIHEKADRKRRLAERKLAQQAFHDPLTGLLNRAGLTKTLSTLWRRFQLTGAPAAILLIDLDHFKSVNDTYGHGIGDAVLRSVRQALLPHLREEDVMGRWGGEEFICVLTNTDLWHLQQIAERLRTALLSIADLPMLSHGKGPVPVSGSIGVSTFLEGDQAYEAAIRRADDSLYAAKRNGRNRVVFDPRLRRPFIKPMRPESVLTA